MAVAHLVVDRPGVIVVAFLLLTAGFAAGLTRVTMSGGTGQFTDASPAQDAYDQVQTTFSPTFDVETGTTLLIQRHENVLSQEAMVRMLTVESALHDRTALRVVETTSPATFVARELDPGVRTIADQRRAIETATSEQIDAAVRRAATREGFRDLVSEDFSRESAAATAAVGVVTHEVPGRDASAVGVTADSAFREIQLATRDLVSSMDGTMTVYGSGIVASEFSLIIVDSLQIVVPASLVLILLFLLGAYRDVVDFLIGLVALGVAVVWTFGAMGWAGIPFSQLLIAVPPLLLGVGIDYGIHVINGYREHRGDADAIAGAMRPTIRQLVVAFAIVTSTTVLGFAANLSSELGPIRNFGVVAAVGIAFTFLVFGVFLPALKVLVDSVRERHLGHPPNQEPLGREGTMLGDVLPVGVAIGRRAPGAFVLAMVLLAAVAGGYGAGVDTSFSDEDFLPPAEVPGYLTAAPEPFAPHTYTVTDTKRFLEEHFATSQSDSVTVYWETPMREGDALEAIDHASSRPPDALAADGRRAETTSILTVIDAYERRSPAFARLVDRSDTDGDGIPDDDLGAVYDALMDSPYGDEARRYLAEDFRSTRVIYHVESGADQSAVAAAGTRVADRYRGDATATGNTVIFHDIALLIYESAIVSLLLALFATGAFLLLVYRYLFDDWTLGLVNLVPILLTVAFVLGTMRLFGMKLNALTATLLAVTIGMGVDYSVHIVHRFVEEFEVHGDVFEALEPTMRGTGGALTGSMLTTTTGVGVLAIAITPILKTFGILAALSILYAYVASVVITPSVAVLWARFTDP
ncbi:MAG: RND family transporter [Halanaeroarchaeum sp.]